MLYDRDEIFEQAKKMAVEHNLFFISDIIDFMPCSKSTFYEYFPDGSEQSDILKDILQSNKIVEKVKIRNALGKSEKAAELLALYRLICTPEEHQRLNQQYIDHTSKGDKVQQLPDIILQPTPKKKENEQNM